jgi:hypothetical protein
MKENLEIFDKVAKAKIPQRDKFILLLILCLATLVNSFTGLLLVKQLPDIVQWILKALKGFVMDTFVGTGGI